MLELELDNEAMEPGELEKYERQRDSSYRNLQLPIQGRY